METSQAMEALRGRLESTFGKAMAVMILATASRAAQVPTVGLSPEEFQRLAEAACQDQRVLNMWGAAGASDISAEMKRLVA